MQRSTSFWIIFLAALALVATAGAQAGDPVVAWNRTYGEAGAGDAAYAIVADPGGAGFFLAGETASPEEGAVDALVIGLTPDGGEEWNRTFGGEGNETARSIIRTDDGNLLFAGNSTPVANGTQSGTAAWIVKVAPSGDEVWNRTYGGPGFNTSANAVTGTDDGGYVFVGSIVPAGENESAAWVVGVNGTGEEVWNRTFDGPGNQTTNAVVRLTGGDLVFTGSTESSGAGMADVWVVRLNGTGDEVWNRTFGSPDDDAGRAVIDTSDGGLLVAGTFTERPDNTTVDTDALLIKLTPNGNITWNWIYGDFGVDESAAAVIETPDGGYLFAGETAFLGTNDTDAWLVATDANGAVAWSKTFGGENPGDRAASVVEAAPGEYVFAGTFNAAESGGPVNTDAWAVRLGPAPEPTPAPTATPTPGPTATPIKPPKAPIVPQKPLVTSTPAATPTATPEPTVTAEPTPTPTPTATPTATPTPTATSTPEPTPTPTSTPTVTPTRTGVPGHDDDDDDNHGSLSGTVWYDLNANGAIDPGEPGIPDINVRLIGERTMMDYTTTGPDGSYRFGGAAPADYFGVEFVLPAGYSCTVPGRDNHADARDEYVAFAEGGAGRQTLNAGYVGDYRSDTPAEAYGWVFGTVWSDDNRDGVRDETLGLTDVEVSLLDADGNVAASTRTGYHDRYFSLYLFGPLLPGEYSLAFTAPDDYVFTNPGPDSHADPSTGKTGSFTVGGGEAIARGAGMLLSVTPVRTTSPGDPPGEQGGGAVVGDGADEEREDEAAGGEKADDADDRKAVNGDDEDDGKEAAKDDDDHKKVGEEDDREREPEDDDDREQVREDDD